MYVLFLLKILKCCLCRLIRGNTNPNKMAPRHKIFAASTSQTSGVGMCDHLQPDSYKFASQADCVKKTVSKKYSVQQIVMTNQAAPNRVIPTGVKGSRRPPVPQSMLHCSPTVVMKMYFVQWLWF